VSCILTLRLNPEAQEFFEALRQRHFPPERNLIAAHLTLFHQLPENEFVLDELASAGQGETAFALNVTGLRSLGRGVAYTISAQRLIDLHRRLAKAFDPYLIPQDRQRFMPHIVVQNKVTGEQARGLLTQLQNAFTPMTIEAQGLELWEYLGGPWKHLRTFDFSVLAPEMSE
jgi:2'-5' RNA ligase